MATHELKILPTYFDAVKSGDKTFEIRYNGDRGFQKGDIVVLKKNSGNPSGPHYFESIRVLITYVTAFHQQSDWVVFAFKVINDEQ